MVASLSPSSVVKDPEGFRLLKAHQFDWVRTGSYQTSPDEDQSIPEWL